MKKITYLFVVLLALQLTGYCDVMVEDKSEEFKESEEQAPYAAEIYAGQEVVFKLNSNATTGYQWELADPIDNTIIEKVGSEYIAPDTDLVGAGGVEVWTFKGLKPGKADVNFKYIRPWEKDEPVTRKVKYAIIVKEAPAAGKDKIIQPLEDKFLEGTVAAIEYADVLKRPNPIMTISASDGTNTVFIVKPLAVILDRSGRTVTFREVTAGEKVQVNYRYVNGENEAVMVKKI